ncbi:AB hydrolase superfamily protein [Tolypocladium ophioglossoides CBS 100239]|uniref:AB hydrolase superfamily protein n=1 Tax=Tolypocladium ophioglossoides (strain CBS 100239) TaxID=1163406 RepID=A0A0L0MYH1_TOLOC|nr:AB hydrolase superfamily protein [Tolypocladium ophioglossoides CBS 100239]
MAPAASSGHEALQPIHPSMAGKLDPVFEKLYNDNVANTPLKPIDLALLRSKYSVLYSYGTGPAPDVGRVYDDQIPLDDGSDAKLDVRVYEPASEGPWPVHIDYHGGGWGLGDLDTEAHICKHICKKANVVVIDVAYRLVPEFAFPTGITDSFAALQHIHAHGAARFKIKPESISLGGVSAGACIALAIAHLARDNTPAPIPLRLVAAGTPVIDDLSQYASAAESPFPSMQENEMAPTLNWGRLAWFDKLKWSSLPSDAQEHKAARERVGWFANLLQAPSFAGLARTVIYTAGADPLRDEGERYAQLLMQSGVEVTVRRFPGVPHPFMHMDKDLWQASEFIDKTAREIRLAHWASGVGYGPRQAGADEISVQTCGTGS